MKNITIAHHGYASLITFQFLCMNHVLIIIVSLAIKLNEQLVKKVLNCINNDSSKIQTLVPHPMKDKTSNTLPIK